MIPSLSAGRRVYITQEKDTLYNVSKTYRLSVADLKKINHLSSNKLVKGAYLFVEKQK